MFKQKNKIKSAVIAITYKCNARCKMCNIWKKDSSNEVDSDIYKKLPKNLDEVNVTGGEPFLRNDLVDILDNIYKSTKAKKIVIPSNGFLTERIVRIIEKVKNRPYYKDLTIAISLDGIGEIHDQIRGVKGAYKMVMNTVKKLKENDFYNIGFGFTFVAGNEDQYEKVYQLSKDLKLNYGVSYFHSSDNYFSNSEKSLEIDKKEIEKQINKTINKEIKSFKKNKLGKCYYLNGVIYYMNNNKRLVPCDALTGSFFLDPYGDVYACNASSNKVGNLKENSFNEIWNGEKAEKVRKIVKNCPNPCWMVCTAKPGIKKKWFKVGMWILKRKILKK